MDSPFSWRPPVVFFQYPGFLQEKRALTKKCRMVEQKDVPQSSNLTFKISDTTHTYNCVVNALKMAGFKLTTSSQWNLKWTGSVKV
jgi:hypothetical protein